MSAAQALLMRSAVEAFWEQPYERRLIHWGTRVHDDFIFAVTGSPLQAGRAGKYHQTMAS
jgi:hypothetical protein